MIFRPDTTPAQHRAAAEAGRASMNGTATMTDKPHMILPNGDKLFEGDYGRTLDGRKVGPVLMRNLRDDYDGAFRWRVGEDTYTDGGSFFLAFQSDNDIIAKWTEEPAQPEAPKLWRDMTPEEKGALLLAHHEGKVIEWTRCPGDTEFRQDSSKGGHPVWDDSHSYRIRPEPKRETVAIGYRAPRGQWREIGAIDLIDGKPVIDSVKIEAQP